MTSRCHHFGVRLGHAPLSQSGTCRTVQTRAQRLTSWSRNVRPDLPMRATPLLPLSTRRVHVLGFHHALSLPYSHAFQYEQTHTGRAWPSKSDMIPCDHGSSPVAATLSSKTQCLLHGLPDRVSLGTFRFPFFLFQCNLCGKDPPKAPSQHKKCSVA